MIRAQDKASKKKKEKKRMRDPFARFGRQHCMQRCTTTWKEQVNAFRSQINCWRTLTGSNSLRTTTVSTTGVCYENFVALRLF